MGVLQQEDLNPEQYIADAQELRNLLGDSLDEQMAIAFARGIGNQFVAMNVCSKIQQPITFRNMI